jgi:fumarate hydratase, class II
LSPLSPRIGYDNAARIAKAAHLNGTSLQNVALAAGLVSGGEYDGVVRPEAMLAPDD